jgi:hypothetical protein
VPQKSKTGRFYDKNFKKNPNILKKKAGADQRPPAQSSGGHIKSAQEDGRHTQYLRAVIHIQMYAIQRFSTEARLASNLSIKYE